MFGVLAFAVPGITLVTLVVLFGAWTLVDGIFSFAAAWRRAEEHRTWGPLVIEGVLGVGAGILTWVWPGITAIALLYVIAAWAVLTGVMELVTAVRLRSVITSEGWLGLAGSASIMFGVLVALFPGAGALGVVWAVGAYAIAFGVFLLALAFQLRGHLRDASVAHLFQQA